MKQTKLTNSKNIKKRNLKIVQIELLNIKNIIKEEGTTKKIYVEYSKVYHMNYFNKLITKFLKAPTNNKKAVLDVESRLKMFETINFGRDFIANLSNYELSAELIFVFIFKVLLNSINDEQAFLVQMFSETDVVFIFYPVVQLFQKRLLKILINQKAIMNDIITLIMVLYYFCLLEHDKAFVDESLITHVKHYCVENIASIYDKLKRSKKDSDVPNHLYLTELAQLLSIIFLVNEKTQTKTLNDMKLDILNIFNNTLDVNTSIEKLMLKTKLIYVALKLAKIKKIKIKEVEAIFQNSVLALVEFINKNHLKSLDKPIIINITDFNNKLKDESLVVKRLLNTSFSDNPDLFKMVVKEANSSIIEKYKHLRFYITKSNIQLFNQLIKPSELLIE